MADDNIDNLIEDIVNGSILTSLSLIISFMITLYLPDYSIETPRQSSRHQHQTNRCILLLPRLRRRHPTCCRRPSHRPGHHSKSPRPSQFSGGCSKPVPSRESISRCRASRGLGLGAWHAQGNAYVAGCAAEVAGDGVSCVGSTGDFGAGVFGFV